MEKLNAIVIEGKVYELSVTPIPMFASGALYQMQTAIDAKPLIGSTATTSSSNPPNP